MSKLETPQRQYCVTARRFKQLASAITELSYKKEDFSAGTDGPAARLSKAQDELLKRPEGEQLTLLGELSRVPGFNKDQTDFDGLCWIRGGGNLFSEALSKVLTGANSCLTIEQANSLYSSLITLTTGKTARDSEEVLQAASRLTVIVEGIRNECRQCLNTSCERREKDE